METGQKLPVSKYSTFLRSRNKVNHTSAKRKKSSGNALIDQLLLNRVKSMHHKRRNNYNLKSTERQMKKLFPIFILSLLFIYISLVDFSEGSPQHYCLRHCHMCKEMYGRHFRIHFCRDDCIASRGRDIPDCLDLNSIEDYLILTH